MDGTMRFMLGTVGVVAAVDRSIVRCRGANIILVGHFCNYVLIQSDRTK